MANNERVNAVAFAANHLKQVGYASTGDISVGGMIIQIADHFGYGQLLMEESTVAGKTKIDMNTLVNQQMIAIMPNYYSLIIHNVEVLALPTPGSISIANMANWLYAASAPSVGDNVQYDQDFSGDEMEEDDRPEE